MSTQLAAALTGNRSVIVIRLILLIRLHCTTMGGLGKGFLPKFGQLCLTAKQPSRNTPHKQQMCTASWDVLSKNTRQTESHPPDAACKGAPAVAVPDDTTAKAGAASMSCISIHVSAAEVQHVQLRLRTQFLASPN